MKKKDAEAFPLPVQRRYPIPGSELGETTACPRTTEFDLEPVSSRTRYGSWGDEQTFEVKKRGNEE